MSDFIYTKYIYIKDMIEYILQHLQALFAGANGHTEAKFRTELVHWRTAIALSVFLKSKYSSLRQAV